MRCLFAILVSLLISATLNAQSANTTTNADTLAPYQKDPSIPSFSIQQPDSSWFYNTSLAKKPALILYFSPDCGHCQLETEEVLTRIKELNDLQIIMVTSRPFEDMVRFADHYKLNRFPTIKIGQDPLRRITRFYDVKFTPFSALYDKKGKLVKAYEQGIKFDELKSLLK